MAEVEIGMGKSGRRAFGFDELAIVPSRRTRDAEDIDISWQIDAYEFELPFLGSAMDGAMSPSTAIEMGRLGGLGVLNLEGLWTRHEDPAPLLAEIADLADEAFVPRLREIHAQPVDLDLVTQRIREINDAGVTSCGAVSPQLAETVTPAALAAELDLLVIQGTVISAEHLSKSAEPLNLKRFVRELDIPTIVGGCASYPAALHLMRTGAAGVLVGVGTGRACTESDVLGLSVPQATAIADARAARMRHLDETGVYVHLIADGGMASGGDVAKAIVCGADAVMIGAPLAAATDAPGRGAHWGTAAFHPTLPRGTRAATPASGSLEEVLVGPAQGGDGRTNLAGALRKSMATCGYASVKEFQKADLTITAAMR